MTVFYSLKDVVKERLTDGVGFRLVVPHIQIRAQEHIALIGHSGCGKSTLLDLLALILHPDDSAQFSLHPGNELMQGRLAAQFKALFSYLSCKNPKYLKYNTIFCAILAIANLPKWL